ncbi:ELMO domain-containing protein 2-like [Lineus longissimus]|uniref:ELMO domain-containing protein 2-like n=1 Tax=Lineus longissimus TaxID=88925 RepID=UPI002B4E0DBB
MWQAVLYNAWHCLFFFLVRPMFKWVVRKVSGRCELLRITYNEPVGASRTHNIETSLQLSKTPVIRSLAFDERFNVDEAVENVQNFKDIKPEVHANFGLFFKACLLQISGYKQLISDVESMRKMPYSEENEEHEEMLMKLWTGLMPDTQLESRISKQWGDIGFQGDDPKTDFRGMGMLGLNNLLYFTTNHNDLARQALSHSQHPQYGYSFAIVGINLTSVAHILLVANHLKTHFYNVVNDRPHLEHFHGVYSYLFVEFDKYWLEEKPGIMEFNTYKDRFMSKMIKQLRNPATVLQLKSKTRN